MTVYHYSVSYRFSPAVPHFRISLFRWRDADHCQHPARPGVRPRRGHPGNRPHSSQRRAAQIGLLQIRAPPRRPGRGAAAGGAHQGQGWPGRGPEADRAHPRQGQEPREGRPSQGRRTNRSHKGVKLVQEINVQHDDDDDGGHLERGVAALLILVQFGERTQGHQERGCDEAEDGALQEIRRTVSTAPSLCHPIEMEID